MMSRTTRRRLGAALIGTVAAFAVGEWICLDAATYPSPNGIGLAESMLFDERGPIGRSAQALLLDRVADTVLDAALVIGDEIGRRREPDDEIDPAFSLSLAPAHADPNADRSARSEYARIQ